MQITDAQVFNTYYFCNSLLSIGDVVGVKEQNLVDYIHKCVSKTSLGIAMQNVVKIDLTRYAWGFRPEEVQQGSKIGILVKGVVILKLAKSLRLPIKQPIYVDLSTSKLTFRKLGPKVGKLLHKQDEAGFCSVNLDFS